MHDIVVKIIDYQKEGKKIKRKNGQMEERKEHTMNNYSLQK
jgi:hypothetical protein